MRSHRRYCVEMLIHFLLFLHVVLLFFLQVFLSLGESFRVELTDVRLVSPILGSLPRLLHDVTVATVTVPEEAASSEVS